MQIDKGASVAFTDIDTMHPGAFGNTKERTTVYRLTKDTDEDNVHNFKSALDLQDYDIKINQDPNLDRNTDLFPLENGTSYDKRLTLRNFGTQMTQRMRESMQENNAIRSDLNLFGSVALGSPSDSKLLDTNTALGLSITNLYNTTDEIDVTGEDSKFSASDTLVDTAEYDTANAGYIGRISAKDFIDFYCSNQSGIKLGDSKVLNPDFQFNELDDLRSNFRRPKIGRIYSERIYDYNMPIMIIQPGIVKMNLNAISMTSSFSSLSMHNMRSYLKDGDAGGLKFVAMKLGNLINTGISWGAKTILDTAKWYSWTPSIRQYMQYVNEMLIELATWMGLIDTAGKDVDILKTWDEEYKEIEKARANQDVDKVKKILDKDSGSEVINESEGLQEVSGYIGSTDNGILSCIQILPQYKRFAGEVKKVKSADGKLLDDSKLDPGHMISRLCIPFAISKGVSVSESFSNTTGEHPVSSEYNQQYSTSNEARLKMNFNTANVKEGVSKVMEGTDLIDGSIGENLATVAGNVASAVGSTAMSALADGEMGMVAAGAGRFILPEIWTDSSFDRSYNISLKFRTPYGHRLAIFENTDIQLLFLLALVTPRAIGTSSYINPFYVKAFCKGFFDCEMGMVTSLSVSRGEDKNDRTSEGFFRTVSVSMTIKDMLPTMPLGLDGGVFGMTKASNNGMIGYMCNLAGVDFVERANLRKQTTSIVQNLKTKFLNLPDNIRVWAFQESLPGRLYGSTKMQMGIGVDNPFATSITQNSY